MTGKPTNEARLIRLEEQVKTLFVTMSEVKDGVNKILSKLENGKIHQFRLDDQEESINKVLAGCEIHKRDLHVQMAELKAFQDNLKGKLAIIGIALTVAAAVISAIVTAALQHLVTT